MKDCVVVIIYSILMTGCWMAMLYLYYNQKSIAEYNLDKYTSLKENCLIDQSIQDREQRIDSIESGEREIAD